MRGQNSDVIEFETFAQVEMRVGTIINAEPFPEARKPAYKLTIDFGEYGTRRSSAQITAVYRAEELVGRQVIAVVNLPPKRIGPFVSECLVCGFDRAPGEVVLISPTEPVPNGSRLY